MNYIENIYICLAAPLLVAILSMRTKGRRTIIFLLAGMTACLLSSYISTFLSFTYNTGTLAASMTIAPFVEEIMKLLPLLFYLMVFEPVKEEIPGCAVMTALGFATFENVCYLLQNDVTRVLYLVIRGFGTGAMHVVCAIIIALGMLALRDKVWLQMAGTIGLLSVVITYHGIYNMLVMHSGKAAIIGYIIPVITALLTRLIRSGISARPQS